MSKDFMFKTSAFGGFKKDEVMDFVEKVLNEKGSLESELTTCKAQNTQLATEIASLQKDVEDIDKLRSEVSSLSSKIRECESSMDGKDTLIKELTERISEAQFKVFDESEVLELKRENERLRNELDKKRDIERQVGAAMLDARLHSEELVEQAKEKANNVTKAVYAAIGDTAVRIDDLSAGIGEIARNFTKSVEEVELRIKALTGNMSKTAQALISENVITAEIVLDTADTVDVSKEYDFFASDVEGGNSFDSKIGEEDY